MRKLVLLVALGLSIAACGDPGSVSGSSTTPSPSMTTNPPTTEIGGDEILPRCYEEPLPSADPSLYRDTPKYVGNETPADAVREWASQYPDFVDVWIDREHNGWVSAGFTGDVTDRQTEIEEKFPDDGVVAVHLDWTAAELEELQTRVEADLNGVVEILGASTDPLRGYVNLSIPVLDDDDLNAIRERFPDDRICVEGVEPENVVPPGPQPQAGDGWRLLVDEDGVGFPYETGIAWDVASLGSLAEHIGIETDVPDVDFNTEVVIWFGAVYGSSCPNIRMDDVVVDGPTIHPVIVDTDNSLGCTADANPHAFLVALQRDHLPSAPFYVAIDPNLPGSRLQVEADLRRPGSTADPDQVGPDPNPPQPQPEGSGVIIETGFPWEYTVDLSCGFEALGEINDYHWVAAEPIPDSWLEAAGDAKTVVVEVLLEEGPDPLVEVTFSGETITYEPGDGPGCP